MRRRDLIAALAGAAVVMVLAGSVAWAAIPGAGGMIHGCYTKIGGVMRVIDTAKGPQVQQHAGGSDQLEPAGSEGRPWSARSGWANGSDGAEGVKSAGARAGDSVVDNAIPGTATIASGSSAVCIG